MNATASAATRDDEREDLLQRMQYRADPLADRTIAGLLDPWDDPIADALAGRDVTPAPENVAAQWTPQWKKLAAVTGVFREWTDNAALTGWTPGQAGIMPMDPAPLESYVQAGRDLPDWADRAKIQRAEELFMDQGVLSVTLLFCSSLPECYVVPDLAAVLQATGQLEDHTEHRIRATGAMIFPVMMKGGLTTPGGGGIAQIFKVRLIHATIRNLILRGTPQDAQLMSGPADDPQAAPDIPPLAGLAGSRDMHQVLFAHGWNTARDGLPCNQEELAYTLLTFSYVFLRSMRKLGLGFPQADEEAYLHAWNVAGHMLGIERGLMAETMDEAKSLYDRMQCRGREDWARKLAAEPGKYDPRPRLGQALMNAMASVIPFRILKPFPVLLTRYLCGNASARDLGLNTPVSPLSHLLFIVVMLAIRGIDTLVRLFSPGFSISRLVTRVLGYRFITQLLMDQTRPLRLPQGTLGQVDSLVATWHHDPTAWKWVNALEDRMTVQGAWQGRPRG